MSSARFVVVLLACTAVPAACFTGHSTLLQLSQSKAQGVQRSQSVAPTMLLQTSRSRPVRTALKAAIPPPPGDWEKYVENAKENPPAYIWTPGAPRYASDDWFSNILTVFGSPMFWRITFQWVANVAVATLVWALYTYWSPGLHAFCAGLTPVGHQLTAFALGLLLVFRTNASYDRFLESRKLWGALVNTVRDCARMAHVHLSGLERDHFLSCLACLPSLLLQHLQRLDGIYRPKLLSQTQLTAINGCLGETDLKLLWKARNRPFALIKMMTAILRRDSVDVAKLSKKFNGGQRGEDLSSFDAHLIQAAQVNQRAVIEGTLTEFCNQMGACERIVKSAVPTSYSRHTSRFLSFWTLTLPLFLVHSLKWKMIPAVAIICWSLFIIEEIGHVIEDPFNIHTVIAGSGQEDELRIEASLSVLRGDSFERLPAAQPHLLEKQGNFITADEYDTAEFHDVWLKDAR